MYAARARAPGLFPNLLVCLSVCLNVGVLEFAHVCVRACV